LSPLLFAVEFHILAEPELDKEASQLVFNLLIHASQQNDEREVSRNSLVASSLLDLVDQLQNFSFRHFLIAKIAYRDRDPISVLELLAGLG
jgi:hypothetical protein